MRKSKIGDERKKRGKTKCRFLRIEERFGKIEILKLMYV